MSQKDYLGKVKGERGLLEKMMGYIPIYHGYKEKELRRESDRLVRAESVNRLKAAKTSIRRAFANPTMVRKLSEENTFRYDALTTRLDRITQRIDKAVAGYAGMFDSIKVKEDKLDVVMQHDVNMIEKADEIKNGCQQLAKMQPDDDTWAATVDDLISKAEAFDAEIDERSEILKGLAD